MIFLTSSKQLNKIIRDLLISQSELSASNVLNATSTYGITLHKLLEKKVYDSYENSDCVLLFELNSRNNNSDVSFTEEDDKITYFKSYEVKLTLYGKSSQDVGNKITARFRTQKILNQLEDEGVYLEKITDPKSFNEFLNEVIWNRTDIDLFITCKFSITQIKNEDDFASYAEVNLLKEGD